MKHLTEIVIKQKNKVDLTAQDLRFLHEIDSPILGFGYERDPRINEELSKRDINSDILTIFDITPEQIARNIHQISPTTKVYIGSLQDDFFHRLPQSLEYIYTEFPKGRIKLTTLTAADRKPNEYLSIYSANGVHIDKRARSILKTKDFADQSIPITMRLAN